MLIPSQQHHCTALLVLTVACSKARFVPFVKICTVADIPANLEEEVQGVSNGIHTLAFLRTIARKRRLLANIYGWYAFETEFFEKELRKFV